MPHRDRAPFRFSLVPLLFASIAALTSSATAASAEDAADLVLRHGLIYTVAKAEPIEGSVAVRDGRIQFVGADSFSASFIGPKTRVIELGGRALTPGLIDAHSHLLSLGRTLSDVDLRGAASYDEVVRRVAAAAAKLPAGAWVRGRGWDQNLWPGQSFPLHGPLSAAVPKHPVWLARVDGHAALLNAEALALLGLGDAVRDPEGGRYLRDPAGHLSGVLLDNAMDVAPPAGGTGPFAASAAELERAIRLAAERCLALGLTTVTDMGVGASEIAAFQTLRERGELPLRAALFLTDDAALLADWFARGRVVDPQARLTIRGVKLYADGALGSRGAALIEPYADDPGNFGLLTSSGDHMADVVARATRAGFQVGIHAIGDRGNLVALDAIERGLGGVRPEARPRIEHAQVMRVQDIERLARLGVFASMQPTHATSDMPWAEARLGPHRLAGAYAWRKVLTAGGLLAAGSDFPVESPDPRLGLYAAVTRQDLDGKPVGGWLPGEALTRVEALQAFTLDAARSLFLDDEIGSIEPGKRADLLVWGRDPMRVPVAEIPTAPIDLTLLDGVVVHEGVPAR